MKPLHCIIFDMDGTLTQTNQLIFDSFNHIARKYQGKTYTENEITAMFGPPEEGALLNIVGTHRLEEAMEEYLEFYRGNHERLARLYPGVVDLLQSIKSAGRHMALFTGKGIHTTTITLEAFGLHSFFDYIVTGNDVVQHKPSSEGIRKILGHFGVAAEETLMIGDSVSDVKASHEAGVRIAAVLWDSYGKDRVLALKTDYVFHSVNELHQWLDGEFRRTA